MIRRGKHTHGYVTIPNELARNQNLSRRARGLLVELLSRPDYWTVSMAQLVADGAEGRDALQTALNELKAAGYARWERQRDETGKVTGSDLVVYDEPRTGNPENPSPGPDKGEHNVSPSQNHSPENPAAGESAPIKDSSSEKTEDPSSDSLREPDRDDDPTDEVRALCDHLADWIERNGNKRPKIGKRWFQACRLMIEVDEHTPEQIRNAIDWCQRDPFWSSNILSMPKLREKYATLRLRAKAQAGQAQARPQHLQPLPSYTLPPRPSEDELTWGTGVAK